MKVWRIEANHPHCPGSLALFALESHRAQLSACAMRRVGWRCEIWEVELPLPPADVEHLLGILTTTPWPQAPSDWIVRQLTEGQQATGPLPSAIPVHGIAGPTALESLLEAHPLPWHTQVSIAGPPGNAEVELLDGAGGEIEVLDNIDYADALAEAVNLAGVSLAAAE